MVEAENLVVIATFRAMVEAHPAKTRLESEGIECVLSDENTIFVKWTLLTPIGSVNLSVKKSDAAASIDVLQLGPLTPKDGST